MESFTQPVIRYSFPLAPPRPTAFFADPSWKPSPAIRFDSTIRSRFWKPVILIRQWHPVRRRSTRSHALGAAAGCPESARSVPGLSLEPRIRGVCFYAATAAVAVVLFFVMVAAHPLVLLLDRHHRRVHHWIARIWASLTIAPFFEVETEGTENLPQNHAPAVYVSNHQSFLDIYTLLTLGRSFKFISKRSIFLYPIIGWAMYFLGVIPLRRMDNRSQLDCLKRCMDLLKKGASVFFFPEGTRSKDGKLGAFKKGAFSVAVKTGVPVIPIALMGTGDLMPSGKEGQVSTGSVRIVIHKPLEGQDAEILCYESRNVISRTLLLHGCQV